MGNKEKPFIPVILGTNRKGRKSENVARWIFSEIQKRDDIETKLIDVRDFNMPADDYGRGLIDRFPEYKEAVISADGFIIVFPEYNHGIPGQLKSVLDLMLKEYNHKAVGLAGVSNGSWGGVRGIENMIHILRELGLVVTSRDLPVPKVGELFDEEGKILDEKFNERLDKFLEELTWMTKTLKWGRENFRN